MKITDTMTGFKAHFLIARGNRPKTYKSVLGSLSMLTAVTGLEEVAACTPDALEAYFSEQATARGWAPKTYRNHWQYLKLYFDWCVRKELLKRNPILSVAKPKLPKALPRAISRDDAKAILHAAEWLPWRYAQERPRNVALLSILLLAGLRLQEALNLRVCDVNLAAGDITVLQGKGGKDRIVQITPQLAARLKAYTDRRTASRPDLPFFTSVKSAKPLTQKNVQAVFRKIAQASGVFFTAHMLRHTYGKLCVEADINLFYIKESMGHESLKTTQRYLSISTQAMKERMKNAYLI